MECIVKEEVMMEDNELEDEPNESGQRNSIKLKRRPSTKIDDNKSKKTKLYDEDHKTVKKFTCSLCSVGFDTNRKLIKHKEVHDKENIFFMCESCKVAFSDHYDYLAHELSHLSKTSHKCVECGLNCNKNYLEHLTTHFCKKKTCPTCLKELKNSEYDQHVKSHRVTECVECGKTLKDSKNYSYHMSTHTGVKLYQCLYCGKGFSNTSQRQVHTRIHTNEKPFECKICHQRFKQTPNLRRHMNTHKTEKNVSCSLCEKKFYHEYSLQVHMRLHLNKELYPCEICGRSFQSVRGLRGHILYKHFDDRPFKCEACKMSFKVIADLKRHNRSRRHRNKWYGFTKEKHNG